MVLRTRETMEMTDCFTAALIKPVVCGMPYRKAVFGWIMGSAPGYYGRQKGKRFVISPYIWDFKDKVQRESKISAWFETLRRKLYRGDADHLQFLMLVWISIRRKHSDQRSRKE